MPAKKTIFQKIGDDAVQAKTEKVWKEWFKILDKFDLKKKGQTWQQSPYGTSMA